MAQQDVSSMITDLSSVPNIVGSLGLSIAAAQKAFNLDYLENLEKMLIMAKTFLGDIPEGDDKAQQFVEVVKNMILALAPSRYQFTETTLTVKLDLAQTMSKGQQVGLGINTGAVAINAAMTSAYGYDAHSAAEVKTVIHAISPDRVTFNTLLAQAKDLHAKSLDLPDSATVDQNILEKTNDVYKLLMGRSAKKELEDKKDGENNGS